MSRNFQPVSTWSSGKGGLDGIERLQRQVEHDSGILPDRVEHDRAAEFRRDLAEDADRLGLEPLQVHRQGAPNGRFRHHPAVEARTPDRNGEAALGARDGEGRAAAKHPSTLQASRRGETAITAVGAAGLRGEIPVQNIDTSILLKAAPLVGHTRAARTAAAACRSTNAVTETIVTYTASMAPDARSASLAIAPSGRFLAAPGSPADSTPVPARTRPPLYPSGEEEA